MERSGIERRATAAARSFGMALAVVAALLLGVVAGAYARGDGALTESAPVPSDPSVR